jgi:CBS domain-containing protein
MSPRSLSHDLVRDTPVLHIEDTVEQAVRTLLDTDLPALPAVDGDGRLKGIFGDREFMAALFLGYLEELGPRRSIRFSPVTPQIMSPCWRKARPPSIWRSETPSASPSARRMRVASCSA